MEESNRILNIVTVSMSAAFFRGQLAFMGNNGFTVAERTWKGRAAANAGTLPSRNSMACVARTLFAASWRARLVKTGKIGSLEVGAAIDTQRI